jgi:flagellar basal body P-ring formation protein FlgA
LLHEIRTLFLFAWVVLPQIPILAGAENPVPSATINAVKTTAENVGNTRVVPEGKPAEVAGLLVSELRKSTPWTSSEIEIRAVGGIKENELPSESCEIRLSSSLILSGRKKVMAPVDILQGGRIVRSLWVTAELSVRSQALTAARSIPAGKTLEPEDFAVAVIEIPDLRAHYARSPEDLAGMSARRVFAPGDPLVREAFSEPFLVRHGEIVRLRLERNGIVLTSAARAEQDGRLGQVIAVRNLNFSTILKAQVSGRLEVRLE